MKNVAKFAGILSIIAMTLVFTSIAFAAVPDKLECDAEPSVIHATWDQTNPSLTEVTVQLETSDSDPVRMCGVEIKCESQDTDVLAGPNGESILTGTTDEFGRVALNFYSTGDRRSNVDSVDIICRSLQQESCKTSVSVMTHVPDMVELSMCPDGDATDNDYPDIIADGESTIVIAAQLKDAVGPHGNPTIPVKKSNVKVKFVSLDTRIVKALDGTDMAVAYTNEEGVAYATLVSAGSGTENEGEAEIEVEVDGGYGISHESIYVETTRNYGTTTINGQLYVSTFPTQILADGTSTVEACAQLRKTDGHIIKDAPLKLVSLVSHNASLLLPVSQPDPNNPAYTEIEAEDLRFPQGGVYTTEFKSAGIYDPNSVGMSQIEASAEFFAHDYAWTELVGAQYWPAKLEVTESPARILCDGESTVKITAQLLDEAGYPVFMSGRPIVFRSQVPGLLVDPIDEDAIVTANTNEFGIAYATFLVKDCKMDNVDAGDVLIHVSTISDSISDDGKVTVVLPHGFKPTGVNVYTDQDMLGYAEDHPAHASPSVISADGDKPVRVTAQVCEHVNPEDTVSCNTYRNDQTGCEALTDQFGESYCTYTPRCVRDPNYVEFCNPVKRSGMRVEFKVMDDNIIMNKDHVGPEDGIDYVYLYTDDEGKATATFRSTGTTPVTNEGCSLIKVTAQDGQILGSAWAQVCARQDEGMTPNAVWTWAQPAFITADGTSSTVLRAALLWCDWDEIMSSYKEQYSQGGLDSLIIQTPLQLSGITDGTTPDYTRFCKPVQLEGAQVKFEVDNPLIVDDGMTGRKIITTTDEYGHASATFYSAGFDTPNIGKTAVHTFVDHIGEDVTPLNLLKVTTEEKTWPWCTGALTDAAGDADLDGDGFISDSELLHFIIRWITVGDAYHGNDAALINVITSWISH